MAELKEMLYRIREGMKFVNHPPEIDKIMRKVYKIVHGSYGSQLTIFGELTPIGKTSSVKQNPCISSYGTTEGKKCKTCKLLYYHEMSKRYYKCRLRKFTHGPGTDHRVNWPACGKYEER